MDVASAETAAKNRRAREALRSHCPTEGDLRAFVLDYMPDLQGHIPDQATLRDQITRLIERAGADTVLTALEQSAGANTQSAPSADGSPLSYNAEPAPWPWFERQWRGMSSPAQQAIREFLDVYLGTARQPSGFGGRVADKQKILDWLANPEAAPYCVVRAVTGRGKSALLSRVVIAVGEQSHLDVVFVPVSLRFKLTRLIDVMHALLGQLAALSGENPSLPTTLDETRAQLQNALRQPVTAGRRRLVVIDGLDEISGWQFDSGLFPQEPSSATKVLLSFRKLDDDDDRHWHRRLGLGPRIVEELALQPLGRTDVLEALHSAKLVHLNIGREELLAERLFKLSQGDPLVLSLLIDECHSVKGLSHLLEGREVDLKAGLSGCWDRMLTTTEQEALSPAGVTPTWRLMAVLSCALAPIPREDVIVLTELGSGEALDRALAPVHRWVLHTRSGYVFNHPGLREFVHDQKLGPLEQRKWHGRFVDWGERVLAELSSGKRSSSAVPLYLLEWLSTHFVRLAAGPERFLALLSSEWKSAWEHVPLGYNGLLQDVELVMSCVETACRAALDTQPELAARHLREFVRCVLWRSSIHSYTGNLDPVLLIPLVEHSLLTPEQALVHLRRRFMTTARHLGHSTDNAPTVRKTMQFLYAHQPAEVVDLALAMADGDDHWNQHDLFLDLLPALLKEGESVALMRVRSLRSCWLRVRCLLTICAEQPDRSADWRRQLQDEACELIQQLPRPGGLLNMLPWALSRLSTDHHGVLLSLALAEARSLTDASSRSQYLRDLARRLTSSEQQQQVFLEAIDAATQTGQSYEVVLCLDALDNFSTDTARLVFQRLITEGRHQSIFDWTLKDPGSVDKRRALLAESLPEADRSRVRDAGLRAAEAAWDENWNIEPLRQQIALGAADEALAIVRKTKDPRKQRTGLLRLIEHVPPEEQIALIEVELRHCLGQRAKQRVDQLLSLDSVPMDRLHRILQSAVDPLARALGLLHLLARSEPDERARLLSDLEEAYQEITDPRDRIELLEPRFGVCPTKELLEELLKDAKAETERTRSSTVESLMLYRLARGLNEPCRERVLLRLVDLIECAPEHMRGFDLMQLLRTPALPPEIAKHALRRYRHAVHGRNLLELLPLLDDVNERRELLRNELVLKQNIGDVLACLIAATSLATSETHCQKIIWAAKAIEFPETRFLALAELGRRLPALGDLAHAEAAQAAESLVDAPGFSADSYLWHHGTPKQVRDLIARSHTQIRTLLQDLEPILKRWRALSWDEIQVAFHDLRHDRQTVLTKLRELLTSVGSRLGEDFAEQLLEKVPWHWIDVTVALLPALSPARKATVLAVTQERVRDLPGSESVAARALLVEHLPQDQRSAAIGAILSNPPGTLHGNLLWRLAPMLEHQHVPGIIAAIASAQLSSMLNMAGIVARVPSALRHDLVSGLYERLRVPETPQNNALLIQLLPHLQGTALADIVSRTGHTSYLQGLASLAKAIGQMDMAVLGEALASLQTASRNSQSSPHDPIISAVGAVAAELTRRDPKHRLGMFDYIRQTLRARTSRRSKALDTLAGLAPLFRSLGTPDIGDRLAEEVLGIGAVWP